MDMTDDGYLHFRMAKVIACTECGYSAGRLTSKLATNFREGQATMETLSELDKFVNPPSLPAAVLVREDNRLQQG